MVQHWSQTGHGGPLDQLGSAQSRLRRYRCLSGASVFSLESGCSCAVSASFSFKGNIHARAAPAVPSPLWREKQRKVAQTKAQQPVKVVRTYKGTKAKFRNWGRWNWIHISVAPDHMWLCERQIFSKPKETGSTWKCVLLVFTSPELSDLD